LVRHIGGKKPRINRKLILSSLPKFRVNKAKPLAPAYAQVIGRGMERSAVMKCPPGAARTGAGLKKALILLNQALIILGGKSSRRFQRGDFFHREFSMSKFAVGDTVDKAADDHEVGMVIAVFPTVDGNFRYAVDMEGYGALQFFNEEKLVGHPRQAEYDS